MEIQMFVLGNMLRNSVFTSGEDSKDTTVTQTQNHCLKLKVDKKKKGFA